jgi:hypothetical protein
MSDTRSIETDRPEIGRAVVVGEFTRPLAPDHVDERAREVSLAARRLARWLPWLAPAALATPALYVPRLWLVLSLVVAFIAAIVRRIKVEGLGPAGLLVAPVGALSSIVRACLSPAKWFGSALPILLWTLAVSVLLPAVVGALRWLVDDGRTGVLTAARSTVVQWGPAAAATVVCICLLRTVLGPSRHSVDLRQAWLRLPEGALVAGCAACVILAVPFILSAQPAKLRAVDLTPGFLDQTVDDWHRDWAQAETDAVLSCIRTQTGVAWTGTVSEDPDDPSLLSLSVRQRGGGKRGARTADISAVAMSLHDQLLGSVREMSVRRVRHRAALVIDRSRLDLSDRPVKDVEALRLASNASARVLPLSKVATHTSLRCGTSAI